MNSIFILADMLATTTLLLVTGLVLGDVGHNQILDFPGPASTENYISYNPDFPALTGLTVCAWQQKSYSDYKRYWFSYAVPGTDNEIILGEKERGVYVLFLGGSSFGANVGGGGGHQKTSGYMCVQPGTQRVE